MKYPEEKIRELKEQASQRGIYVMARHIARELGTQRGRSHGSWWDWSNDEMSINYDDYGNNISVDYRGTVVYSAQLGETMRYRPDIKDWEEKLWNIHSKQVLPIIANREKSADKKLAEEMLDRWGIKLTVEA